MSPGMQAFVAGPLKSFVVSQAYAIWGYIVFAVTFGFSRGEIKDFPTLLAFLASAAFPLFMAIVFGVGPYARAKQGADRVNNTVTLADGAQAVITKPPAPPAKETP